MEIAWTPFIHPPNLYWVMYLLHTKDMAKVQLLGRNRATVCYYSRVKYICTEDSVPAPVRTHARSYIWYNVSPSRCHDTVLPYDRQQTNALALYALYEQIHVEFLYD